MRQELITYLQHRPDLQRFLRAEPIWYRRLGRDPYQIEAFEKAAKQFYGQTFFQKIDRFHEQMQMIGMLLSMFDISNEK